ncbi:MAG: hypothetical protein HY908_20565 [Myxococcales bacterium]|nr:hypothetical protein [Myxococcales bacterium]
MSFHAARRLLGGALLLTLAAGAVCRQQNDGPGDVPPGGDCAVPADMVATIAPVAAEYCTYSLSQPDTCACGDAQGPLPPDVILPYGDSSILLGCHQDVGDLGIRYVHESCALIAEVSGPVVWDYNPPGDDDDRVYAVCPEPGSMRVDPWTGPPTELRTQGSFMAPATLLGSMHIEIQDCRWYDGVYAFERHVLDDTDSTYSFGSRPTFGDQLAVAGDWVADFNHNGTEREEAHAEIHEARMLAKVQRVNAIDDMHYVALTNGFFASDSPQQERLHLDIPIPRSQDPLFNKLTCELISVGYGVAPSCGTKSGVLVKPVSANSALGTCTVELTRNDAVAPNDYNCTDTCSDLLYPDDPAFCDSVHFMSPVRAEWKDPADLWMCNSCACDDPSAPGAHITAPVQGCAQAGLDPNNPDHQAIACAQVCGVRSAAGRQRA